MRIQEKLKMFQFPLKASMKCLNPMAGSMSK